MTPLGCPDCLLIRYEPRALWARLRARARARAPSRSHFRAKLVSLDFFFFFKLIFLECTMYACSAYESREFLVLRVSNP